MGKVEIVNPEVVGKVKRITLEAVVTRADGTVEDLGVISESRFGLLNRIRGFFKR
jgi:hypothetical protein